MRTELPRVGRPVSLAPDQAPPIGFRPIEAGPDGSLIVGYARDLFAISFGPDRFAKQFGEDGRAYVGWVAEKQSRDPGNAVLALLDEEPIGMVVLGPWPENPTVGYVFHYYLAQHARRLNLAPQLDAYATSRLESAGFRMARLSVSESNERALRFYRRQGWAAAGPRQDQPGVMYMQRSLRT